MRRVDRFDEGLMVLVVLVGIALGAAPLSVNLGKPQRAPLDLGRPHTATGAFLSASHIPGEADRPMRGSPAWAVTRTLRGQPPRPDERSARCASAGRLVRFG